MPTFCRACDHKKRDEIDAALTSNEPYVLIAQRFKIPMASILHHRIHLPDAEQLTKDEEIVRTDVLLVARMKALQEKCLMLILAGESASDPGTLFSVVSQVRKNLVLLGEFADQLHKALGASGTLSGSE
jgi:hypothetical protein